jgi:hypothetical protein
MKIAVECGKIRPIPAINAISGLPELPIAAVLDDLFLLLLLIFAFVCRFVG